MLRIMSNLRAFLVAQSGSLPVAMYPSHPRSNASCRLSSFLEMPTTSSAPSALANKTAKCPKPPMPTTATLLPGPAWNRLSGAYTVAPAQSMGAANSGARPVGILTTKCEGARW